MKERLAFCWSGGKDSALALYRLLHDDRFEVVALLTTFSEEFERISMHGVRMELADAQAHAIGLPLVKVFVGASSSNDEYATKMAEALLALKRQGVTRIGFGDLFLEDLKIWREEQLATMGLSAVFPLWKTDTSELLEEFLDLGFRALICCVSDACLDERALGQELDRAFVKSLPPGVDRCGENGEYHSFTYAGPLFAQPLTVRVGAAVYRPVEARLDLPGAAKGFWFCDLLA